MNCANHPDRDRAAFCQNCGKPLCTECIRTVGNSIFCEPCFAARTAGYSYVPPPGAGYVPPVVPGEPNPGLAALLGFIPGVGAMYNEQYAKGIVHLAVFAILVSLASDVNGIFGLFIAGWIFYMVIEAHHTARARRDGTPLPNPFGLNDLSERLGFGKSWPAAAPTAAPFTAAAAPDPGPVVPPSPPYSYPYAPPVSPWGAPQDAYTYTPPVPPVAPMPPYVDPNLPYQRRFPAGAVWLIALGLLFLFGNSGIFIVRGRYLGPFLLIGIGVWVFVRKMTCTGLGMENDGTPHYQYRLMQALRSSVWLFITGFVWLLDVFHILSWGRSWPIFLIAGGIMLFVKRTVYATPYPYVPPPYPGYPTPAPAPPVTSTEIVPTHPSESDEIATHDQEGR